MRRISIYRITFLSTLLVIGGFYSGMSGCGTTSSSTRGATTDTAAGVDLKASVSLPSSTSSALSALGFKSATAEVPQSGLIVEAYKASDDSKIGECTTDTSGECTVPDVDLSEGEHDIFFVVKDSSGSEKAGSIGSVIVGEETTSHTQTVNSAEDLAYKSWRASCEEKLGEPCVPGTNISQGIAKVVPRCIRDTITDMAKNTVASDTVGGQFGAFLEAHKNNMASGFPVDPVAILKGDASAQSTFGSTFGEITALKMKSAVTATAAASTAASTLDKIVDSLCGDPTNYATVKADINYKLDPGVIANLFASIDPGDVGDITSAMKTMILNSISVGNGLDYFGNPLGARAMMETFFVDGFSGITADNDFKKRVGTIMGGGVPADVDTAKKFGVAARNIFAADTFANVTSDQALNYFGPVFLKDADERSNCLVGGKTVIDNYITKLGSLDNFVSQFNALGGATAFLNSYEQKGVDGTCTAIYDCQPPLNCSAGRCKAQSGVDGTKLGVNCATSEDCGATSTGGLACEPHTLTCVYPVAQGGSGTTFAGGYTPPAAGSRGGPCFVDDTCTTGSGLVCVNGQCNPPSEGTAGSEICGDGRCNGSETSINCSIDCGTQTAGTGYCGDATCQSARGEDSTSCPTDCSGVNLPSTFTVTRGIITTENNPLLDPGDAGGTHTMTISSQMNTSFSASIPVTTALASSFMPGEGVPVASDTTTGSGTKSQTTWSVTMTKQYTTGNCTFTYSQTLSGTPSPFGCSSVEESLTTVSGSNCAGFVGSNTVGASTGATYGNATCTQ